MRTTLSIDDQILARAKAKAKDLGVSLGKVVEDALRRDLQRTDPMEDVPPIPVLTGDGVRPGVDLTSNRALSELLDGSTDLDQLR